MPEGLPLPWPFPWSKIRPSFSRVELMDHQRRARNPIQDPLQICIDLASTALARFNLTLPKLRSAELYLVSGVSKADFVNGPDLAVIYKPEFIYLLDCGLDALVGVSILWENKFLGDPAFPDFSEAGLRSVASRDAGAIIFPRVAGKVIVGIEAGTDENDARAKLEAFGLKDVEFFGFFATASCPPFHEDSVCRRLDDELDFVGYAQPDHIQRIIDFGPGWQARRVL